MKRVIWLIAAALLAAPPYARAALSVGLSSSAPAGAPVGTRIYWTASAPDDGQGAPLFRFDVRPAGGTWRLARDYARYPFAEWTTLEEGLYEIRVTAVRDATGESVTARSTILITPRVTSFPLISPTPNPLVALYSAPPCGGSSVRVRFAPAGTTFWRRTPWKACRGAQPTNFYIAGMRALSTYVMQQDVLSGTDITPGPVLTFRAGLPTVTFEPSRVDDPADASSSLVEGILLSTYVVADHRTPVATDLGGSLLWYYDRLANPSVAGNITRPLFGGSMLMTLSDDLHEGQILREIDLAGNTVRETHLDAINRQLRAMGKDEISAVHHEATRLSNGHTLVLGAVEKLLTDVQGPGTIDVLGDMILDLDQDFTVAWIWSGFDHLDVTQPAVLGETCVSQGPGCPPLFKADTANDWMHSNAISYDPHDGNLLLSIRHHDHVIKVDYENGTGNGAVVWTLGRGGDFTLAGADPSDPWPWFSHQHDAEIEGDTLSVYDNGNTRVAETGGGNSRGMVLQLDEAARQAQVVYSFDLGAYSFALGSAERLANGNYHFDNGFLQSDLGPWSQSIEVTPTGTTTFLFHTQGAVYRSFRMTDLYRP